MTARRETVTASERALLGAVRTGQALSMGWAYWPPGSRCHRVRLVAAPTRESAARQMGVGVSYVRRVLIVPVEETP